MAIPTALVPVLHELRTGLTQLREEVSVAYETLVRPTWDVPGHHHYPVTLYGYMMAAFSRLDLYSRLWDGGATKSQSARMRAFLVRYLPRDPLADALAIQLWRHTLMHTSRPRRLRDKATGREYEYLLHWGPPHLPRNHHYRVANGAKLDLALGYFLEDLEIILEAYATDLNASASLQTNALSTWPTIAVQEFEL